MVGSPQRCAWKDADTSDMADLTVLWRSICFLVVLNWFLCTEVVNDDTRIFLYLCGTPPGICLRCQMFEECAPPIPVSRLLGCNGFGDAVGCVEAAASDDIQEITVLGVCLMWNDAAVCGDRIWLNFF